MILHSALQNVMLNNSKIVTNNAYIVKYFAIDKRTFQTSSKLNIAINKVRGDLIITSTISYLHIMPIPSKKRIDESMNHAQG